MQSQLSKGLEIFTFHSLNERMNIKLPIETDNTLQKFACLKFVKPEINSE